MSSVTLPAITDSPPIVVNTVKHNFYVDDCLKSMASEEEAVKMIGDSTALCHKGGFNLYTWRKAVLLSITEASRAQEMMGLDSDTGRLLME